MKDDPGAWTLAFTWETSKKQPTRTPHFPSHGSQAEDVPTASPNLQRLRCLTRKPLAPSNTLQFSLIHSPQIHLSRRGSLHSACSSPPPCPPGSLPLGGLCSNVTCSEVLLNLRGHSTHTCTDELWVMTTHQVHCPSHFTGMDHRSRDFLSSHPEFIPISHP